jgi:hypothetical protein
MFWKRNGAKPACAIPECSGGPARELHELLANNHIKVNIRECKEDEDKEGCVVK